MLVKMRDSAGRLCARDMLDLDFDMYVEKREGKPEYQVVINPQYTLDGRYENREEAEAAMNALVDERNNLELELRRDF